MKIGYGIILSVLLLTITATTGCGGSSSSGGGAEFSDASLLSTYNTVFYVKPDSTERASYMEDITFSRSQELAAGRYAMELRG